MVNNNIMSDSDNGNQLNKEFKKVKEEEGEDKEHVLVKIKDNGNGIDKDILPMLFEKFATKSETGTGLGLYISKSIVEAHGGKIWTENNSDGKGATFRFTFPIIK